MVFAEPEPTFQQDSEREREKDFMYLQWSSIWRTIKLCLERKKKKESNKFPEFEFGKYDIHNKLRCEAIFEKTFCITWSVSWFVSWSVAWKGRDTSGGHALMCIPVIPHLIALPRERWNLSVFGWIQLGLLPVLLPPAMHSCSGSLHDRDYEQQEGFLSMLSQTCERVPFGSFLALCKGVKAELVGKGLLWQNWHCRAQSTYIVSIGLPYVLVKL